MTPLFEAVIGYATRDLYLFPCEKKKPLTHNGFKDASLDPKQISDWWTNWPNAQIGLPTGQVNHLFVIDVDGPLGQAALEQMDLPSTFTVETQPGHWQFWFRQPEGITTHCSASVLAKELDVRGDGGYVIAPPSIHHETGKPYWILKDIPWADAPAFLLRAAAAVVPITGTGNGDSLHQGSRRPKLFKIACKMRREGLSEAAIYEALKAVPCDPPLPDAEIRKLAHGTTRYDGRKSPQFHGLTETCAEVETECLQGISPEAIHWLWRPRAALGKLNLFAGDPGLGKSMVTIDIIARLSQGKSFPDGETIEAGDALVLTAEDGLADTVVPRLIAAGANLSRVHRIKAVKVILSDGTEAKSVFSLDRDIEKLEVSLANLPDVKLLVIDPLSAYLGNLDSHHDAEIRRVLTPLSEMAERRRVAVLGIMHLNKSQMRALLRVSGSVAFVAAARVVWGFGEDPDNPGQRVMIPIKNNLAPIGSGLAYRIEVAAGNGRERVAWEGSVTLKADDVLGSDPREKNADRGDKKEAMEWLRAQLSGAPVPVKVIESNAKESGLSWATIRRAKDRLPIDACKTSIVGGWCWELKTRE